MEHVAETYSELLEAVTGERFEDALAALSGLANARRRVAGGGAERAAAEEVWEAGKARLVAAVTGKLKRTCRDLEVRARDSGVVADTAPAWRLVAVAAGVALLEGDSDDARAKAAVFSVDANQTDDASVPDIVGHLLWVYVRVEAGVLQSHVEAHHALQRKAKKTRVADNDAVFLEAVTRMADLAEAYAESMRHAAVLEPLTLDSFVDSFVRAVCRATATPVVAVLKMLWDDRDLPRMLKRAKELGGLTLPRALAADSTPSRPPSSSSAAASASASTSTTTALAPLSPDEATDLDCIVHDLSVVVRACERVARLNAAVVSSTTPPAERLMDLNEESAACVSALVALDELWVTHNVTKAVRHAVSLECADGSGSDGSSPRVSVMPPVGGQAGNTPPGEPSSERVSATTSATRTTTATTTTTTMVAAPPLIPHVNSVAEDVFHVVNVCFARAVHSSSRLAAEASANIVCGFLGDAFLDILRGMLSGSGAAAAAATNVDDLSSAFDALMAASSDTPLKASPLSPARAEALNTLATAVSLFAEFEGSMRHAFGSVFGCGETDVMAPSLLAEARERADQMLAAECEATGVAMYHVARSKAVAALTTALDPRGAPYEMGVAAYESSGLDRPWIRAAAGAALGHGGVGRALNRYTRVVRERVADAFAERWTRDVESKLEFLRFTALGALRFEADVRALCEAAVVELGAPLVRGRFRRLRHWAFLLNLERAADVESIPYPSPALSAEEVRAVLGRRVEKEFFRS